MKWITREKIKVDRAACLWLITLGLSDHEVLDREFIVYDALYAECKRRATSGAGA